MARINQLIASALLSLTACHAVHGQEPEPMQPAALQLEEAFATQDRCQGIDQESQQIFNRCELGSLDLLIPKGFALQGLQVEVNFQGSLRKQGDQIAAVVRTQWAGQTISDFKFHRLAKSLLTGEKPQQQLLQLKIKFPDIIACDADRRERLSLKATYFVNAAAGRNLPQLQYQNSKVTGYDLSPVTCEEN